MEHSQSDSNVAVIGMACRVAGADSPSALWDLLASSKDVQSQITRFNAKGYYHPEGGPRKGLTNVKNAYMLDDDAIGQFDHAFFQTTPVEAIAMDPQHRMLLEIAYEAVENAGIPLEDFVGTDTAVYAGMDSGDYHSIQTRDIDDTPKYLATGTPGCFAANRLSYFFNLSGASLSVDSACSSTMAALHQAVRTIQNGESKAALVCGAKIILTPDMFMPSSELGFLSPSGRCRSFDAGGDGYGRGEGVLAVLLKPFKEALANRDPIRAVIKGTRLNQDGRTQGITLPSSEAQKLNMESLYRELGVSPNDVQYVEAHGTGTAAGDPLEFSAINSVFRDSHKHAPLVVGSIKSNVGHLEACAGLAAVIKAILCLERGKIPPQMHFDKPNPKIDFHNVEIPTEMMDWPSSRDGMRRAAINTFGAGGTNGHAIIEKYNGEPSQDQVLERPWLFKVSAMNTFALKRLSVRYADHVESNSPNLQDLAYTTLSRRSTMKQCMFFTASTLGEAVQRLRTEGFPEYTIGDRGTKKSIMVFTGQGAQWPEMGKVLIHQSPIFKATLLECDRVLACLHNGPDWSIIEQLSKVANVSNIYQAEYSQPLCTALQLGLVAVWRSWGFAPNVVVGHSSGEIAAAYAAGIISLRDAIVTAYYRGYYLTRIVSKFSVSKQRGCMCAVGMSAEDANKLLDKFDGRVQLASINSETSCTLSGDKDAIENIVEDCASTGTFCRKLHVDMAYHSHHMEGIACHYQDALIEARVSSSAAVDAFCDMFSSVTSGRLDPKDCSPAYWTRNLVSTVRYASALTACMIHSPEGSVILEVGPHPALKGPSQEILRSIGKDSVPYFHSCVRGKDDFRTLLDTAGAMIAHGVPLKTPNINAREVVNGSDSIYELGNALIDLPSYSWEHSQSFWTESKISRRLRFRQFPRHQLLGSRYVEDTSLYPSWRSLITLREVPWLEDFEARQRVGEKGFEKPPVPSQEAIVIPPTVFVLMALEAARQLQTSADPNALKVCLSNVIFMGSSHHALFINADTVVELHLIAHRTDVPSVHRFEILSTIGDDHNNAVERCSGRLGWSSSSGEDPKSSGLTISHDPSLLDKSQVLGKDFTIKLKALQISSIGATGEFEASSHHHENYLIDPVALNSILHLPPVALLGQSLPGTNRITGIDSITIPAGTHYPRPGRFTMTSSPIHSYGGQSSINIKGDKFFAHISGLRFEVDHLTEQKPAPKPLYFRPVMLPDITRFVTSEPMALHSCIEMTTHKWPMCDIGLRDVNCDVTRDIVKVVVGVTPEERPRFRSVTVQGEPEDPMSDRLTFVGEFDPNARFHILFEGGIVNEEQSLKKLLPHGLLCTRSSCKDAEMQLAIPFKKICRLTGFDEDNSWTLWRTDEAKEIYCNRKAVVFACSKQRVSSVPFLPAAEHIPLEPASVKRFFQRSKNERYDAIVIDCIEKSVITTWSGEEFIPWLQALIVSADTILWVTQKASQSPFANIAGALLRTLQAEKPSLKVTWLASLKVESDIVVQKAISSAYDALWKGENEIKYEMHCSQLNILRYQPDGSLCALTGHVLPMTVPGQIVDKNYEVSLAKRREPVILSSYMDPFKPIPSETIRIKVEASIIDWDDVIAFNGSNHQSTLSGLGKFFAGQVTSEGDRTFPAGSKVVGWQHGAHHNSLEVLPERLEPYSGDNSASGAAAAFAACAMALCIVDGFARARLGDTFKVNVGGILREAISFCCEEAGAAVLELEADQPADFDVSFGKVDGLFVNGTSVNITTYLQSRHGAERVAQTWKKGKRLMSPLYPFQLSDLQQAFENAQPEAYSTVLVHTNMKKVTSSVAVYNKGRTLFSSDGAYILVGGLGGIGRFVLRWMVANGAKQLIAISRNGLKSQEAQDTFAHINATDASLKVLKVDACNRKAMANALAEVRETCPISGVINLAMLLGDSPLDQMTGWQWDRALRLKIDSSWILHEETINDPLEFFILFSSIASILGNRSQAGYNVGNAFLNALADYRKSLGLTAISIALGAMTDIGVLHEIGREDLLQTLSRSGLSHLRKEHLASIMEAAVSESSRSERSLIVTGLEMFERVDGKLVGSQDQTQLYWTELPELGFLQTHRLGDTKGSPDEQLSLRQRIQDLHEKDAHNVLLDAFLPFLSQLLGFPTSTFTPSVSLAMYGLDSLSAVSCQYWFHRTLSIDVSVLDVLNSLSINQLITKTFTKFHPEVSYDKTNDVKE